MKVFNERGEYAEEFLHHPEIIAIGAQLRSLFTGFEGDIRHLSHALQGEVTMCELRTILKRSRQGRDT